MSWIMKIANSDILDRAVVETLEHRQMLSGVAFDNGVLTVTGLANSSNTINVWQLKSGSLRTTLNGKNSTFKIADVKGIHITGGDRADAINVDSQIKINVLVKGLAGNDTIATGAGNDAIDSGSGDDYITAGSGNDALNLGTGNDRAFGEDGNDTLSGDNGNDALYGNAGNDLFRFVESFDRIQGGAGQDSMFSAGGSQTTVSGGGTSSSVRVTSFSLIDASTNKVVNGLDKITEGQVLDLASLPEHINIRANIAGGSASVRFDLNGTTGYSVDSTAPYALAGGTTGWNAAAGSQTLVANAMLNGKIVSSQTLHFTVKDSSSDTGSTNSNSGGTTTGGSTGGDTGGTGTGTQTNASDPVAIITAISTSVPAGHSIALDAISSTMTSGAIQDGEFVWNFGDPTGQYNTLKGFSAGHTYDKPGSYNVTLTVTNAQGKTNTATLAITVTAASRKVIYVSTSGSDSNAGTSQNSPVKTFAKAMSLVDDNTEILFARGETFNISAGTSIGSSNVVIGAYGIGDRPTLFWNGARDASVVITTLTTAKNVAIQDVTFDSAFNTDTDDIGVPVPIRVGGECITVRRNQFLNMEYGVNCNLQPQGLMLSDNVAPLATGIRKYFAWVEGKDISIIGNTVANSTREHVVRVNLTRGLLVAHNDLTNLIRRGKGDDFDIRKAALNVQSGSYGYLWDNHIDGPLDIGPLGGVDGLKYIERRFQYVIADHNTVVADNLHVHHGALHVTLRNNVMKVDNDVAMEIEAYSEQYGRGVEDINIHNNTVYNAGTRGNFLIVYGQASGIRLTDNLLFAPNLTVGSYNTGPVVVEDGNLSSFTEIDGNVWPVAKSVLTFIGEQALNYIGKTVVASGFQTIAEWNAINQVGTDYSTNPTVIKYDATVLNGHIAGVLADAA